MTYTLPEIESLLAGTTDGDISPFSNDPGNKRFIAASKAIVRELVEEIKKLNQRIDEMAENGEERFF